jgi:hypothetical protein
MRFLNAVLAAVVINGVTASTWFPGSKPGKFAILPALSPGLPHSLTKTSLQQVARD